jgi:hypothetical protein
MKRLLTGLATGLLLAAPAAAQQVVGTLPTESKISDLYDGQRFGTFVGWMTTGLDPVGVRAQSAPIVGIRYDVLMGSPAYFTLRLYGMTSSHEVVDPTRPANNRLHGTATNRVVGGDASVEVSLTGDRAWHGIQPLTRLGLGVISGVANHFDATGYAPGASVVYLIGTGVRWSLRPNLDMRTDLNWMVHQMRYPEAFKFGTSGDTAVIRSGTMTPLVTNRAVTVSFTWGIFR